MRSRTNTTPVVAVVLALTLALSCVSEPMVALRDDVEVEVEVEAEFDASSLFDSFGSFPCDLIRRPNLTLTEFERDFLEQRPVVFSDLGVNEVFRAQCARAALVSTWGDAEITLSTANAYSYEKTRTTLRAYVSEHMAAQDTALDGAHTQYHFGDHTPSFEPLLRAYVIPRVWNSELRGFPSLSWGLAGDGSGVPFHVHGHVFAEVLHGRKHWMVAPPSARPDFDPNELPMMWMLRRLQLSQEERTKLRAQELKDGSLLECTLGPGEILYLPSMWWHATLNLGQSVFISAFV